MSISPGPLLNELPKKILTLFLSDLCSSNSPDSSDRTHGEALQEQLQQQPSAHVQLLQEGSGGQGVDLSRSANLLKSQLRASVPDEGVAEYAASYAEVLHLLSGLLSVSSTFPRHQMQEGTT